MPKDITVLKSDYDSFNVYKVIADILCETQDRAGPTTDIKLIGFDKAESEGIENILVYTYSKMLFDQQHKIPKLAGVDLNEAFAKGVDETSSNVSQIIDLGDFGKISIIQHKNEETTSISMPNINEHNFPAHTINCHINELYTQLFNTGYYQAEIKGDEFVLIPCKNMEDACSGFQQLDALLAAHHYDNTDNANCTQEICQSRAN